MAKYQGHKNWNHWNVSLWINTNYWLHQMALGYIESYGNKKDAAIALCNQLCESGHTHTPDGAPYSVSSIRAAMVGM